MFKRIANFLTLSSPHSRLGIWALLSIFIYLAPFKLFENLSLLKAVGLEGAPSIGLTRSYWFLIHGQPQDAFIMNPIIFLVLLVGIPLLLKDARALIKKT